MSLPSYNTAVQNVQKSAVYELLAPFLDAQSLAACCLVSQKLNSVFSRTLWKDPIRKITQDFRVPCRRILHFLKSCKDECSVSSRTRDLVAILDFRSLERLRYECDKRHDRWNCSSTITGDFVHEHLSDFPNCKAVFLDDLPLWKATHHAPLLNGETNRLLVLSTAHCKDLYPSQITSSAKLEALLYLDVSGLIKIEKFPDSFSHSILPNLRILKLRSMRLQDRHITLLLQNFGPALWSLDLNDNLCTDTVIPFLDNLTLARLASQPLAGHPSTEEKYVEDSPSYRKEDHSRDELTDGLIPMRPDGADTMIRYLNQSSMQSAQPLDDHDDLLLITGLTQLRISSNRLSSIGIFRLMEGPVGSRIQLLDVGNNIAPPKLKALKKTNWGLSSMEECFLDKQYLGRTSMGRLESLRVHHSITTRVKSVINSKIPSKELPFIAEEDQPDVASGYVAFSDPDINPRLHTLVLTGVPQRTIGIVLDRLIVFLKACAAQELKIQALKSADISTRRSPKILPGLRILRLEFQPPQLYETSSSVSEHKDADIFLAEAETDFSFFREALPEPTQASDTKHSTENAVKVENDRTIDVIEGLKRFRRSEESRWGGRLELVFPEK